MKHIIIYLLLLISTTISAQTTDNEVQEIYGDGNFLLEVQVVEAPNLFPVNDVNVYLFRMPSQEFVEAEVTENGLAYFNIEPKQEYQILTCKRKYMEAGIKLSDCYEDGQVFCVSGANHYSFQAEGEEDGNAQLSTQLVINKMNVGKIFELENIYFDLDKSFLRPEAKDELDELYNLLMQYPSLKIELSSHTDSRASNEYNMALSQRRAESSVSYLYERGIDKSRVTARGYGERRLVNECEDGVQCTEAQHQKNRRTEFEILEFEGKDCEIPEVTTNNDLP